MMEDETAHSDELWKKLAEIGLARVAHSRASFGGMGGSFLDATVILEEMGKTLLSRAVPRERDARRGRDRGWRNLRAEEGAYCRASPTAR